ncbi:hypothetical protein QNI16_13715 [Cytophagaceae bacterium YF14B1]|uniref:Uncharacterized protein n=1 Tax=Xanthocytophaga flava TaxID=3048013 RepID=A0AAE3QMV4_9BACT|nr:hypothetical protein [Xanthocytophaga flavus]MDJ1481551.1 hypothetical protein [Xanthocytophaga flavus]
MSTDNIGLQAEEVARIKRLCKESGQLYILNENEPQGEEFAHFIFAGTHKGKEVVFDSVLYTLRLHHMSVLYESAEDKACEKYPEYNRIDLEEEDDLNKHLSEAKLEEIELFKAEIMDELEETEEIKVQEYVNLDPDFDYGIALEACLNVEEITPQTIARFVKAFTNNTLELDKTLYSFKHEEE